MTSEVQTRSMTHSRLPRPRRMGDALGGEEEVIVAAAGRPSSSHLETSSSRRSYRRSAERSEPGRRIPEHRPGKNDCRSGSGSAVRILDWISTTR